MTPYIFRKYEGYNPNDIKCWSPSYKISPDSFQIENTVFHRGSSKAGTAIPTPLARMELFDTAFHIVATEKENNLAGSTIYHQLVSDCLDVMQLIFNCKNSDIGPGKKMSFKEWRVKENIEKLKSNGDDHPHFLLGKAYEQVFSDGTSTDFPDTDSIFLIYYEGRLLGGTSPLTLFFTSPNWTRYLSDGLILSRPGASSPNSNYDYFFDENYKALFQREEGFVRYLFKLFLQNKDSFSKCDGLRKYINKVIDRYYPHWRTEYNAYQNTINDGSLTHSMIDNEYEKVITDVEKKFLTINGIYFYHQKEVDVKKKISSVSDFTIKSTVDKYKQQYHKGSIINVEPPLVLVNGMNVPGDYLEKNSPWDSATKVKEHYYRGIPLFERKLPQGNSANITYPFVTTDDFLEENLLQLRFNINKDKFYTGSNNDFKYLLPIKKEYFNFFSIDDLKRNLTLTDTDGSVSVTLKIPIKNTKGASEILFTKSYSRTKNNIAECVVGLGIYPFLKIEDRTGALKELNDYTILLAERNSKLQFQSLDFFSYEGLASEGSQIVARQVERSTLADVETFNTFLASKFYKLTQPFDYMELSYSKESQGYRGLIIPDFSKRTLSREKLLRSFTFAVDFGTSNTHIAYMENGSALPKPFEIGEADQQMVLLNEPGLGTNLDTKYESYGQLHQLDLTLKREFTPSIIHQHTKTGISYPFKTATSEVAGFGNVESTKVDLFSHINIGYYIDKETKKDDGSIANNIVYTTNLKWLLENNIEEANISRVKFFLKQLLSQIKSKALLNFGNPNALQVVWSVPLSMNKGDRSQLKTIFNEAFKEVFKGSSAKLLDPIPESIAPYFYLTKSEAGVAETANAINVDIGGGTSDIMMFMESVGTREDKYLSTSFRFAGSDIWGSGYKGKLKDNGFIKNYLKYQQANKIDPKPESEYFSKVFDDGSLSADDLVSLLFKYDEKFKFSNSIKTGNPDLSLVLYIHYSAIIYHICQIIELKQYPLPRYLSFTGKASQYIRLICGGDDGDLLEFTKLLFSAYTSKSVSDIFEIHLSENPKEITANGAVLYALAPEEDKRKYPKKADFVHPGFDNSQHEDYLRKESANNEGSSVLIGDTLKIDSPLNLSVLKNVNSFLELTLANRGIVEFLDGFKITNQKEALKELRWNEDIFNGEGLVYDSYKKALVELNKQEGDKPLPESLFFYSLKDALYRLSKSIVEKHKK